MAALPTLFDPRMIVANLRIAAAAVRTAKTRGERLNALRRCDILLDRLNAARRGR